MYNMSLKKGRIKKRRRKINHEKWHERIKKRKKGEGKKKGGGYRKWLLKDQPCVRLASGDINTSDAAVATILPFTAGEGDKRTLTKGKRERV